MQTNILAARQGEMKVKLKICSVYECSLKVRPKYGYGGTNNSFLDGLHP